MELPNYDGLIEQWKVDLIITRAKLMQIPRHDLPDVLQEIVPDLIEFRYDPNNSKALRRAPS